MKKLSPGNALSSDEVVVTALARNNTENAILAQLLWYVVSSPDSSLTRSRGSSSEFSVRSERRVLSSGMHKILWWRQHVGQLLVGIYKPAHTHSPAILSSSFLLDSRSCLRVAQLSFSPRLSLSF